MYTIEEYDKEKSKVLKYVRKEVKKKYKINFTMLLKMKCYMI